LVRAPLRAYGRQLAMKPSAESFGSLTAAIHPTRSPKATSRLSEGGGLP
jgi:hypothetical protein